MWTGLNADIHSAVVLSCWTESGCWHVTDDVIVVVTCDAVVSAAGKQFLQHTQDVAVVDHRHSLFTRRWRPTTGTHVDDASNSDMQQRQDFTAVSQRQLGVSTPTHTGRQHAPLDWTRLRTLSSYQCPVLCLLRRQYSHADWYGRQLSYSLLYINVN